MFLGHDGVAHPLALEARDEPLAKEAGIPAHPKARAGDPRRHLRQTDPEERDGARGRHRVAGPQAPVPELLPVRLEAEERRPRFLGL